MLIDRIFYTNVCDKKETKKAIAKNAKKKKFDYEVYLAPNRIKNSATRAVEEQLAVIADARKQRNRAILVVSGKTIFDFSPLNMIDAPNDYAVAFLNGNIAEYIEPSEEFIAIKQKEIDEQYEAEMAEKWGAGWREWLDWWKRTIVDFESQYEITDKGEVQKKMNGFETRRAFEEWFCANNTANEIVRNLQRNELLTHEYFSYLIALKRGAANLPEEPDEGFHKTDAWLCWLNTNIREGNKRPLYKGESGHWLSARMEDSSAYILNAQNLDLSDVYRRGKEFFAQRENRDKTMAQFLSSLPDTRTYVISSAVCGNPDEQPTPKQLTQFDISEDEINSFDESKLPHISVISTVFNSEDEFFLTLMSFQNQDYPPDLIEWVIVDDSTPGREVQAMLPTNEHRIRYLRCNVANGNRLTLGRKLNIAAKNAKNDYLVVFGEGMFYSPLSLKSRVIALLKNAPRFGMVGSTRIGFYHVPTDISFTVQQRDVNDHRTVYHQETVAFTRQFWRRRLFHENLVEDFNQNIVCIPFTMDRYGLILDIPFENIGVRIDTANRQIPENDKTASFRTKFDASFLEALMMLERENVRFARQLKTGERVKVTEQFEEAEIITS